MNRRVSIFILVFAAIGGCFFYGVSQQRVVPRLTWNSYGLPPCRGVKINCLVAFNVIAISQDGSVITVASKLPASATSVDVVLPVGTYNFMIMASGYTLDGQLKTTVAGDEILGVDKQGYLISPSVLSQGKEVPFEEPQVNEQQTAESDKLNKI